MVGEIIGGDKISGWMFDLGNTLIRLPECKCDEGAEKMYRYLAERLRVPPNLPELWLNKRKECYERAETDHREYPAEHVLKELLHELGIHASHEVITEALDKFFELEERSYTILPDVHEVLSKLQGPKVLVTNATYSPLIRRLVERFELIQYFRDVIISADVGVRKPHPYIFEVALNRLGLPPNEVAMVGDTWRHDIEGAINVGVIPIYVGDEEHHPHNVIHIHKLTELLKL